MTLLELKNYQKALATKIREMKKTRKSVKHGFVFGLMEARSEYRYCHIAYCIARGRTYEQIEPSCKDDGPTRRHVENMYKRVLSNIQLPVREVRNETAVCGG